MAPNEYIIGLDYGEKRIGVALAHEVARLPHPLTTLENTDSVMADISAIVQNEHARLVVVGLPRSMDGGVHAQAKVVEAFAAQLAHLITAPITFVDETLTSVQAEQLLKQRAGTKAIAKGDIDALSAALILERYFEEQRA